MSAALPRQTFRLRPILALGAVVVLAGLVGCPGAQRRTTRFERLPTSTGSDTKLPDAETPHAVPTVTMAEQTVDFDVDGAAISLRANVAVPRLDGTEVKGPVVVIVPGGSDISRRGLRRGDGVITYPAPVAVTTSWQQAFGGAGAWSLAYDKRTCGPNDDAECQKNPQVDVDATGPIALAKDVDAACAAARLLPGYDGRLVLMAHGQGAQVALSAACAKEAKAIVLLNPIPRAVDAVLVDAVSARQVALAKEAKAASGDEHAALEERAAGLKNLAASRAAAFASMTSGKFSPDARVDGATIAFWVGWIGLTAKTPALVEAHRARTIVVVADGDSQLAPADRERSLALPAAKVLEVHGDHHTLVDAALDAAVTTAVLEALEPLLAPDEV